MSAHRILIVVERALAALERRNDVAFVSSSRAVLGRRDLLAAGATTLAGALLSACDSKGPDDAERLLRFAERRNEVVERWLLKHTSMDHASGRVAGDKFPSYFISDKVPVWDVAARGPWALEVSGLVARPLKLTVADLERLPVIRHRVNHFCVEGWNAVAEWWGPRVSELARVAGALPEAQYVDFQSFDKGYHESWDLESATHPQTIIAIGKDGAYLPPAWGAPARLHSPVKLGYKSTKYLTKVVFMPERNGGYWSDQGYEWYAGT
jgi:DMSO/TMAO reductase YedYZ molybdopterin-dependent catalytic subunit